MAKDPNAGLQDNLPAIDPLAFRETLGNFPTGVVAVTAIVAGAPVGMVVGTFASVSLDPPLVAYFPGKASASYALVRQADRFCVNVLSVEQEELSRLFAMKNVDKFAEVEWELSEWGSPRLNGAVAWIDCVVDQTLEGGDHDIVLGRVLGLETGGGGSPLLFFQGGYGGFRLRSLLAPFADNLSEPLQAADLARSHMEQLSEELELPCFAQAIVERELVIIAGTGKSARTQIGRRLPFAPPFGAAFMASGDLEEGVRRWTSHLKVNDAQRAVYRQKLEAIVKRGWSYGLYTPRHEEIWAQIEASNARQQTPAVERQLAALIDELLPYYDPPELPTKEEHPRILNAPVTVGGKTPLVLSLFGLPEHVSPEELQAMGEKLRETAEAVATELRVHA